MKNVKRWAVIGVALSSLMAAACGDSSSANTGVTGAIVLIDTPDNGMTTVTLFTAGGTEAKATVTTDAMGGFRFAKVPAGTYRLHAEHSGYAALERDGVLVSDSQNGEQNLGNLVMNRLFLAGGGSTVSSGDGSPDGKRRIFTIDGVLQLYDQDSGTLTPLSTDFPFAGGFFTVDDQYLLAKVQSTAIPPEPSVPDMSTGDFMPPAVFALYVVPLAGGAPWAVSYSAITAGVGPNGQFGFVVVPASSGDPSAVDLYVFQLGATATEPKLAGAEIPLDQMSLVRDTTYAGNLGLYKQVVFQHDPVQTGFGVAYDWSALDVSSGTVATLVAGVDEVECSASADPSLAQTCILSHHTGDAVLEENDADVYVYRVGEAAATKVASMNNRGGAWLPLTPDLSHIPGSYLFDVRNPPETGTDVYLVQTGATLAVENLGRFAGNVNNEGLGALDADATHGWIIRINAGVAELVMMDLLTGTPTVVQSGLTDISTGAALDATASLFDPNVAQIVTRSGSLRTSIVVNTAADATTFTPVYVDLAGAHPLPAEPVVVWGRFSTSQDGKLLAFEDVASGVGYAKVGAGALTVSRVPGTSGVVNVLARASLDGAAVAYGVPSGGGFLYHLFDVTGMTDVGQTSGGGSFSAVDLWATAKMVVATDGGTTQIFSSTVLTASPFGPSLSTASSQVEVLATANGQRLALRDPNASTMYEVVAGAGAATVNTTANVSAFYRFPSAQRYLVAGNTGMTLVDEDGTETTLNGQFYPLHAYPYYPFDRSPDGERLFFRDSFSGDVFSFGSSGAPTSTGLYLSGDSATWTRVLGGDLVLVMNDVMQNLPELVAIDRASGVATVLSTTIQGFSFADNGQPSLAPWQSRDEKTFYYFERIAADPMTMMPSKLRLSAFQGGTAGATLGDGVQGNPLPAVDAAGDLELRTAIDSLHGTATIVSIANGTVTPVTVATGVRSSQLSPTGASRAAIVIDGTNLALQSGPAAGPLAAMGNVQFFDLADNLAWGDQQLYVIDRLPSASDGGTLYTGGIGQPGLTKIARDVIGVFPDKLGTQAAVVSIDPSGHGVDIGRFTLTTLGN